MNKKAFTLAEVLITLGIIGVVAAMTLPTINAKYKEKVMVTQLKKTYSEFENALKMYAAQNGCSDISCISDTTTTTEDLTRKLFNQFKGAKYCTTNDKKDPQCINTPIKANKPLNNGNGQTGPSDQFRRPYFVAANGSAFQTIQLSACPRKYEAKLTDENGYYIKDSDGNIKTEIRTSNICAYFYFDVNGTNKGPNQVGADVYQFSLDYKGKLNSNAYFKQTITSGKLNYTPYEIGVEIKK